VNLPSGGSVTYTVTATVSGAATGTLSNTATVTAPAGVTDPTPGNNSATDTDSLTPSANLSITKTDGRVSVSAGGTTTYTIVASNAGPSLIVGATVTDTFPAAFSSVSWTCVASVGSSCNASSGTGSIAETVSIAVGGTVTYTAQATVGVLASGTISNTATVALPAGAIDPVPGNNSATDVDVVDTNGFEGGAKNVFVGSTSSDVLTTGAPNDVNYFRFKAVAGRSYCVEVDNGKADVTRRDTVLTVLRESGSFLIGTSDNVTSEPGSWLLSRFCFISSTTGNILAKVTAGASNQVGGFRLRVVETTLTSPWFFSANGYESFILVRNTTAQPHSVQITARSTTGAVLAPAQAGTVPANGSFNMLVSAAPPTGFGLTSGFGGVTIAHDGPPGSITGNVTSINMSTGVSFDTPAAPRQDHR
jgi:uncharacterized repeat protein (TIGR01451 family)